VNLTNDDVEEIIRIRESSFYDELRITTDAFDLTLRRSNAGWTEERLTLSRPSMIGGVESEALPKAGAPRAAEPSGAEAPGGATVRAPMIGTFYRAPRPGVAPFVDIGAKVGQHTVIGIIEVMKLMNSVSAGAAGTVTEIYASDGQLVEAEQVLMRLRQPPT
jgi:acetyl-CoA carboxylase biotin carboxyl carrier protein